MPMGNFALLSHFALLAPASLRRRQLDVFLTFLYQSLFLVPFPTSPCIYFAYICKIESAIH